MRLPAGVNRHYGRFTIIHRIEDNKYGEEQFYCLCECGQVRYITGKMLKTRHKKIKSCGCLNRDLKFLSELKYTPVIKNPDNNIQMCNYGYYLTFCVLIRERDNNECQMCGKTQEEEFDETDRVLYIHHINDNHYDNSLKNVITLCRSCHMKITQKNEAIKRDFRLEDMGINIASLDAYLDSISDEESTPLLN